ncbi:serralysin [Actibacterium atlanticum]|uniref:Serralysin n=1 Tax=Actibacterium atlanticum TaxID=1461693 RepID=A0A058ZHD6_9RHOB|nr:M10 family metallopeptidase [Actibacterium atlanticum]KCV81008.1 serralysin [Actibacterium atlanticum]
MSFTFGSYSAAKAVPADTETDTPWGHLLTNGACPCCGLVEVTGQTVETDVAALLETAASTDYTDAIDWGGAMVDTGVFNEDGDMVIEYYFAPGEGRFQFVFPRQEWTEYEKQQAELAFDTFEAIMNVEFVEVQNEADAEFVLNKINSFGTFLGVMTPPGEFGEGQGGFAGDGTGWDTTGGLEQGGFGFITLIHELGHGLGLAHPHDNGGGSPVLPGVSNSGDTGFLDLNQGVYTMMSYIDGWATHPDGQLSPAQTVNYGYQGTPMAVDVAALQEKYGANMDYATGNDVYILPDSNEAGTFWVCIWDAGGIDEIRHDGTDAAVIDLRAATLELEEGGGGWISWVDEVYGGFTIANGVVIENATGGSGNDALIGNSADNVLTGNGGDDTFIFTEDGGGYDTLADFEDGDLVDLSDLGFLNVIRNFEITDTVEGLELDLFDGQQVILFAGYDQGDLGFSDFVFI